MLLKPRKVNQLNNETGDIINLFAVRGKKRLIGSASLRATQYASDYDVETMLNGVSPSTIANLFQKAYKEIGDDVWVTDFKCGLDERLVYNAAPRSAHLCALAHLGRHAFASRLAHRLTAMTPTKPQTMTATTQALTIDGLETVYDALATAIDQAGPDKAQLFLVKLALLNADALGDAVLVQTQIDAALKDL